MKFKFDVLLVIFIFLLSGCYGSDFILITTPVGSDIGTTERVSVASDGSQADDFSANPAISGDGRYVAFNSAATNLVNDDTNWQSDVFVHDRVTGITERVSVASDGRQGDDFSANSAISDDGRYVSFDSAATNLVAGDTNWLFDIFVKSHTY